MKRILGRAGSCFVATCLLAPLLSAQTGGSAGLSISAPQTYVVAARGLQLGVRAVNSRGALLRGRTYEWQVSDSNLASIDSSGLLSGRSPGAIEVSARDLDSGLAATRRFYVYPAAVGIGEENVVVQAGDSRKLSAFAKDADGKEIPGVPFQWFSELPGVARISADGTVTGVSEGRVTVSAAIEMGPELSRFSAFLSVQVSRRAGYKLKSLVSSDTATQAVTTLVPTRVAVAGNNVAGLSSLSNGGQGLLLWQNGRLQTLATTGSTLNGRSITSFQSVTVNSQGDVAVIANTQAEWCEQILALFPAGARTPTILDDTTRCSYWNLTPNSIDRQRNLIYRYSNTLYQRKPDGTQISILSVGDRPPGIDTVNGISNWSVTASGKVLIETQNSSNVSVYFLWDGGNFQKLFTSADRVGTYTAQWARLPVEVAADEYIARIGGSNWASISRLRGGNWTVLAVNGQNDLGWVQDGYSAADGNIFFFADRAGKTSLFRNNGTTTEVVGTYPNWRELSLVVATGGDSAIAYGTLGEATPRAIRFRGTSTDVILGPGLAVDGGASIAVAQASVPKGVDSSATILRTFGDSLLRATPGGVATFVKPGDTLPNGKLSYLGAVAGNRQGDVAFTAQHGPMMALYLYRAGQIQVIADTGDRLGFASAEVYGFSGTDSQIAVNNAGHVAATTYSAGGNGIFLYSGAASAASAKVVAKNGSIIPGTALTFTGTNYLAIDENDRVAFVANTSAGRTGLFIYDQGNIRQILETGQTDPNGRVYQGLQSLQAAGSRFYLRVAVAGLNELLVVDGTTVNVLAFDGYTTTYGAVISNLFGSEVAANSRGDVVLPAVTPSGPALLVRRTGGPDVEVAAASVRGPDGEWFLNLYGAGIGEQGDLVFVAQTWSAGKIRLTLYQASPN